MHINCIGFFIISGSILFLLADYFLRSKKIYKFLSNKLMEWFALTSHLYNLQYGFTDNKKLYFINYIITHSYTFIKVSLLIAIISSLLFSSLFPFFLPLTFLFILLITLFWSQKASYKKGIEQEAVHALQQYQPVFVFYFSAASSKFCYHIKMWLPYLKHLNLPFYIMIRERDHLSELLTFVEETPIVVATKLNSVEAYLPETTQMAFYANNGTKNTHLVRFNDLLHIQLLHGDSEKPPSFNPVSKMYDKLFVSGQRAIDRYYENNVVIDKNAFEIIGRPQVSNIKIQSTLKERPAEYTVLFAPTWVGFHEDTKFSSLFHIYEVIEYLIRSEYNVKIILRLHPLTDKSNAKTKNYLQKIETLLEQDAIEHLLYSEQNIVEDFNMADCIVTDTSSVPIDFLFSEKPIIHIDVNDLSHYYKTDIRYAQYSKAVYMINANYSNVESVFHNAFINDVLLTERQMVKTYYHGTFSDPLEDVFKQTVLRLYEEHKKSTPSL